MAVAVSTTVQDVYPPRVQVSVTGLSVSDLVTVYRSALGVRTPVRAMTGVEATDTSLVKVDAEFPFGVPITYVADVDGAETSATPLTVDLPGGKAVLSDAITGVAAEVVVTAWPEKRRERRSTAYPVGGRTVVVSGQRGGATGSVEVYTETDSARESLDDLLASTTSGVLLLRGPDASAYGGVDTYLAVLADTEQRFSQDGTDERRRWVLEVVEVAAWAASFEARGFTYQDVADAYTGLTYADAAADYATYLAAIQGDYS